MRDDLYFCDLYSEHFKRENTYYHEAKKLVKVF